MPLEYKKGENPFQLNYFNILKIGPHATKAQIRAWANELIKKLKGGVIEEPNGIPIDEYTINEAATKLQDPATRVEEMLLAHPPAFKDQNRIESLTKKLKELANLPVELPDLVLAHPLAVLWFLPPPGISAAELPKWEEFGLGQAGDEEDQALDIVFDQ
jgi:hypothetical protein